MNAISKMSGHVAASAMLAAGGTYVPMIRARDRFYADADVTKMVGEFTTQFQAFRTANDAAIEAVKASMTAQGAEVTKAVQAAADAVTKVTAIAANLSELEQKYADKLKDGKYVPAASVGQLFANSAEFKAVLPANGAPVMAGFNFSMEIQANTITGQSGSPVVNDDALVPIDRRGGIVPGAFRILRIADFLPRIPTTSNQWQFVRELLFTNNAAEVAEGVTKAESVLTFEDATVAIRTIAHWLKASNQILADAPALAAYIDGRLRYGVDAREDSQLITGNGTGQNISGMTTSGNYTAFTPTTGETAIDSLNRAKYAIIGADYLPTGAILNPSDWGTIERLKEATTGGYLVGNPFGTIMPMMWGVPVITSNNMTATKFHMADYTTSYEYVERQSTVVQVGLDGNDFTKNLVTIRAEKRAALATIRPASTRFGSLSQ